MYENGLQYLDESVQGGGEEAEEHLLVKVWQGHQTIQKEGNLLCGLGLNDIVHIESAAPALEPSESDAGPGIWFADLSAKFCTQLHISRAKRIAETITHDAICRKTVLHGWGLTR